MWPLQKNNNSKVKISKPRRGSNPRSYCKSATQIINLLFCRLQTQFFLDVWELPRTCLAQPTLRNLAGLSTPSLVQNFADVQPFHKWRDYFPITERPKVQLMTFLLSASYCSGVNKRISWCHKMAVQRTIFSSWHGSIVLLPPALDGHRLTCRS